VVIATMTGPVGRFQEALNLSQLALVGEPYSFFDVSFME
jgi:hypothetical protein